MVSTSPTSPRRTSRRSHPAPARPRGLARRTALLEATLGLLAEHGADGLTHRRVAERAGLPLASTTYWFDSKEHLLTEALRYAADRDESRLRTAAEALIARCAGAGAPPSPPEIVAVLLDPVRDRADAEVHAAERGALLAVYALMLEAARRPALQALSLEWSDAYRTVLGDLLTRAGSHCGAEDARILMACADGLLIDRLSTGSEDDLGAHAELERVAGLLIAAGASR